MATDEKHDATATVPRPIRPLASLMRGLLVAGAVFVFGAGVQLYVLSSATDRYFAWTIADPLTAATLGGLYFTAFVVAVLSVARREWCRARVGIPAMALFVWLTLFASLTHLGAFHLHSGGLSARVAAISWIVIYVLDAPLLLIAVWLQLRAPGGDSSRRAPASTWHRLACAILGVPFFLVGAYLYVRPVSAGQGWAWPLTPLAAQAFGAWCVALAGLLAMAVREADWERIFPASAGLLVFSALELAAMARYSETPHGFWAYVWLTLTFAAGGLGAYAAGQVVRPLLVAKRGRSQAVTR